jgi:hypothetical protein
VELARGRHEATDFWRPSPALKKPFIDETMSRRTASFSPTAKRVEKSMANR